MTEPVLSVRDLKTYFFTRRGVVRAVDRVSFDIYPGECLCLVGESGCGKTVTALSIPGLVDRPGRIVGGQVLYGNRDLVSTPGEELRKIRGKEIALIFQDAQSAFNPVFTIGDQIAEQVVLHLGLGLSQAEQKAVSLLEEVGIPEPRKVIGYYPHQLSGGMRQRAMIAMSLSCDPRLVIADEPTTAVDVTIKAQILALLSQLKRSHQTSLLFITHELSAVVEIGDRVAVMYAGKIVEVAPVPELVDNPCHAYTVGLIRCLPDISRSRSRLDSIPGVLPDPTNPPAGCLFHPRCYQAHDICRKEEPALVGVKDGHAVACHIAK